MHISDYTLSFRKKKSVAVIKENENEFKLWIH